MDPSIGETFRVATKALEEVRFAPHNQITLVGARFDPESATCKRALVSTFTRAEPDTAKVGARTVSGLRRALETQERRLARWWRERSRLAGG